MIRDDFHVELANWDSDGAQLRALREQVFVVEQQVPAEDELDGLDAQALHVAARTSDGSVIGTARMTAQRTIGRMAVLREWRGRGVGSALLRTLVEHARARGWPEVELHAQSHAIAFYARAGFSVDGDEFLECGIAHRRMRLALQAPVPPPAATPTQRPQPRPLQAQTFGEVSDAMLVLLADARHEVALFSRDLEPGLLDNDTFVEAFKRIALGGRRARVRILVQEPRRAISEGHGLLRLAQQLPSVIELRVPVEDRDLAEPAAFLINDRGGYLVRALGARPEADGNTCGPGRHAQLLASFNEIWERSQPSADLRVLGI